MSQTAVPRPSLTVLDVIGIVVGIVIGAGIFETPTLVAANAKSGTLMLLAWVAGGLMSLIGAMCFAELATAYPHPGGNYHYLVRAFGTIPAFLFVWARLAVIQTGSIAMLGYIFGDYASEMFRIGPYSSALYATIAIVVLTAMNVAGVQLGKWTQNLLTLSTVIGMALIVIAGFKIAGAPVAAATAPVANGNGAALGMVMIFVLLTYGGWTESAYVSAELRNVRRDMARALLGSIGIITAIYVIVNLALLRGLGIEGMAGANAVAAEVMRRAFGNSSALIISLLVAVTVLSSMNATVITGARTNYAMGRDYPMFHFLGRWSARGNTPMVALLVQAAIALGLVGLGMLARNGFRAMVEYTTPVYWFFLLLTGISLMVLRRREPDIPRPFKVPLYPFTPLAFCAIATYMLYSSLTYAGLGSLVGVAVLAAGAPFLLFIRRREVVERHTTPAFTPVLDQERKVA